jgi:hypothetical protein
MNHPGPKIALPFVVLICIGVAVSHCAEKLRTASETEPATSPALKSKWRETDEAYCKLLQAVASFGWAKAHAGADLAEVTNTVAEVFWRQHGGRKP